ncbi:hypothetical protein [Tsukamurella soli]|uniref:Uncharacterized protein n=1 Tax=Tsukamurella soli TaxID=644556 RepID=A0ABP8KIR6_9ACTN
MNVGELRALLDRLPDDAVVLTSGYEAGYAPASGFAAEVQQLDRGFADWLGPYELVTDARRLVTQDRAPEGVPLLVGDPVQALLIYRRGR